MWAKSAWAKRSQTPAAKQIPKTDLPMPKPGNSRQGQHRRLVPRGVSAASWPGRDWVLSLVLLMAWAGAGCGESSDDRPGDTSGHSAADGLDRSIRVLLLKDVDHCRLSVEGPVDLRGPTGGLLAQDVTQSRSSVELAPGRFTFPELGQAFAVEAVDVLPRGSEPIAVQIEKDQWRRYLGALRLIHTPQLGGAVVNVADVEDYLVGVVAAELPRSFHVEAFRAQAIAARTYAWYQIRTVGRRRSYDVTATQSSQVYAGLDHAEQVPKAAGAVRDTSGRVCTWSSPRGDRIFCTYYSSTCGGWTQAAGPATGRPTIAPLAGGVRCEYCARSPTYRWGPVPLTKSFVTERLRQRYPRFDQVGPIDAVRVVEKTPGGWPVRLSLLDAEGRAIELRAGDFRLAVNGSETYLRSTFFTLVVREDDIVFTDGRGFGHGLGMCQYGADGLARTGRTAEEILAFYYPSSTVALAY